MHDWWHRPMSPYGFLILGGISIAAAIIWMHTGRVWVRSVGWVYRAREPKWFWWNVALYFLVGVFFIGLCLYKSYEFTY
jgi:hypothetical protein